MSAEMPAWVRELELALPVYPQVLLIGNVRDRYLLPSADGSGEPAPHDMTGVIDLVCRRHGYAGLALHDIITRTLTLLPINEDLEYPPAVVAMAQEDAAARSRDESAEEAASHNARLREVLVSVVDQRGPAIGLVFPYAAHIGGEPDDPNGAALYSVVEALGHAAMPVPDRTGKHPVTPYNTVFWIAERQEQLPAAFPADSRRLRVIAVPDPSLDERRSAARVALRRVADAAPGGPPGEEQLAEAAGTLASLTHGMHNVETFAIGRLAEQQGLPPHRLEDAARLYRVGVVDNPWAESALLEKIKGGTGYLNARVLGQPHAVRKTIEIFQRSATGLTGAQTSSSPNRPRGVLFLSGPTGVGKTELAKGIATLILGDDARPLRFDMSEFAEEHARDRLIGAPPGYVGHDAGGELTNAVRANPMSVLLFDEIDKAHPRLFDLFLQILEDGRLTDGHGATVYFTESVLVFTSNLGIVGKTPEGLDHRYTFRDEPETVRDALRKAFEAFFDRQIKRPELRNRFGDNFIVMDFIQPETVPKILDKALESVAERVLDRHGARLTVTDDAYLTLRTEAEGRLDHGGRGVLNAVESALVNPLAAELFERPAKAGESIAVDEVTRDGDAWLIEVTRCPG
ncbi:MAG TPA: AAA family ATPase [Spirillospora sp.]|nr:AAA family ATPase [Spirillospora sp.]